MPQVGREEREARWAAEGFPGGQAMPEVLRSCVGLQVNPLWTAFGKRGMKTAQVAGGKDGSISQ